MWLWRLFGMFALALGAIGLFLPVWPTTIFWIMAALCFTRSHPPTRDWIYARPGIGPIVEGYVERGELSRASKVAACSGMALSGGLATFALWDRWMALGFALILLLIGALYVATRREPTS